MRSLLFAILVLVVGCQSQQTPSRALNPNDTSELDVLVSFLAQRYDYCVRSNTPLVIQDTFSIARMGDESHEQFTRSLLSQTSDRVPVDLIHDFCAKNAEPQPVWADLKKHLPVILLSRMVLQDLFSDAFGKRHEAWNRFYAKYSKSPGIITISRVGFNRTGDRAMVYLGSQMLFLVGSGRIHILRKEHGKWIEDPVSIGPVWDS